MNELLYYVQRITKRCKKVLAPEPRAPLLDRRRRLAYILSRRTSESQYAAPAIQSWAWNVTPATTLRSVGAVFAEDKTPHPVPQAFHAFPSLPKGRHVQIDSA